MNNIRIVKRKIDSLKAPDTSFKKKPFRPIKEMPAVVERRIKPLTMHKPIHTRK